VNRTEAALTLGIAASFDGREVTEEDAIAWGAALHDIRAEDARDAVVAHYRESRFRVMPADIIARVKRVRRDRIDDVPPPTPPYALADSPKAARAWSEAVRRCIADGMAPEAAADEVSRRMQVRPDRALGVATDHEETKAAVRRALRMGDVG
jgi:hypothetical protein